MYIITVELLVKREWMGGFRREMIANARASRRESGCRQFDVCISSVDGNIVFLYEAYDDRSAFDAHLATPHFASFTEATEGWIWHKTIRAFERLDP